MRSPLSRRDASKAGGLALDRAVLFDLYPDGEMGTGSLSVPQGLQIVCGVGLHHGLSLWIQAKGGPRPEHALSGAATAGPVDENTAQGPGSKDAPRIPILRPLT